MDYSWHAKRFILAFFSLVQLWNVTRIVVSTLYPRESPNGRASTPCQFNYPLPYQKLQHRGEGLIFFPKILENIFSNLYKFLSMTSVRHTLLNAMFRCGCLLCSVILRIPVIISNQPHAESINCSYLNL